MPSYVLAQCNIARLQAPLDTPLLADFVAALEPINELADQSPGFVWRLETEDGDATAIRAFADEMLIINMSVWESLDALAEFVYRSAHRDVMRRRREWFDRPIDAHMVLWWIPAGSIPTVSEAQARLELLQRDGPTLEAFTFRAPFAPPGADDDSPSPSAHDDWFCSA